MLTQIVTSVLSNPSFASLVGISCLVVIYYYGALFLPQYGLDIIRGYRFLTHGREMIREASKLHGEKPFSLPTPSERIHVVSSKQHFAEMTKAHTSHLSLHAAVLKIFSPKYILGGFQFPDRRDIEGMNVVRALRSANARLAHYVPKHFQLVEQEINTAFMKYPLNSDEYVEVPLLTLVRNMMIRVNTLFIISEETSKDQEFFEMTVKYANRALLTAELCRLTPAWSKGIVSYLIQGNQYHRKYCFDEISRNAKKYIAEGAADEDEILLKGRNASVLEFLTRCYPPEWSIDRLVREVAMAWMPAMILLTTVAANLVQDIFLHSAHIPALRDEIATHMTDSNNIDTDALVFLESFITESARIHSYESTNIHRAARHTFKFSDGYTVPKGDWVEFNQQAVFNNPILFPRPETFDPYRHLRSGRKYKDVAMEWPMWGAPKLACPGRFMADRFLKVLAVHILTGYDCKLSQKTGLNYSWRESEVPNPAIKLLMRRREKIWREDGP